METILLNIEEGIAYITLNRPEAFNSFNEEMGLRFIEVLEQCEKDDNVKVLYLTGSGRAFSAGQDIKEISSPDYDGDITKIVTRIYNPAAKIMRSMSKPIVAAVNGVAAGAGANIALLADIVVASEKASFIQAFSKIGLIPDTGGSYTLPRLIGWQKSLAVTLLGDKVSAAEAERLGMIYKVLSPEEFEDESKKIAKTLAALPALGMAHTKHVYNQSLTNSFDEQLALEEKYQAICFGTEDYAEGVAAFAEKRNPVFMGK